MDRGDELHSPQTETRWEGQVWGHVAPWMAPRSLTGEAGGERWQTEAAVTGRPVWNSLGWSCLCFPHLHRLTSLAQGNKQWSPSTPNLGKSPKHVPLAVGFSSFMGMVGCCRVPFTPRAGLEDVAGRVPRNGCMVLLQPLTEGPGIVAMDLVLHFFVGLLSLLDSPRMEV